MSKSKKILFQILQGTSDKNISFKNLQPKGSDSNPYQVKQVRQLILKYKLGDLIK